MAIHTRTSHATGTVLAVGRAEEFGLTDEDGLNWVASCEAHNTLVFTATRATAMSSTGLDFCDDCRAAGERPRPPQTITRISRATGTSITIANVAALGATAEPGKRWLVSCDEHDTYAYTATKTVALRASGLDFCESCRNQKAGGEG